MVHLHGLATAGAMLTCAAVVLNLGPFAKTPKIDSLIDQATSRESAASIMPQSVATTTAPSIEIQPSAQPDRVATAVVASDVPEPIRPSIERPSVVEVAYAETQAAAPPQALETVQAALPQQDLAAATPLPHPPADQANPESVKKATIVGVWSPDEGTCSAQNFRAGVLPAVINAEGAWAGETFCVFTNKKETETGWRVVAKCSNQREHWTTNVRLTVHDNRLTWTSKRGTQTYTRCAPDVLMAAAR
jgi:hypothetical protein